MARYKEFDKDKVLNQAKELFWLKGYEATSIQDLVDHLGISRSSLYDTFQNKHTLYLQSLEHYQKTEHKQIAAVFDQCKNLKTAFKLIFKVVINNALNDSLYRGCFTVNSVVELAHQDIEVAQKCNLTREKIETIFYNALVKAQETGKLNTSCSPRALARFFYSVATSIQVIAKAQPDRQVLEDIATVALSVIH